MKRILLISIVLASTLLTACMAPSTTPTTSYSPPTPALTPQTPVKSPPITIALDYFGIRNTHWINQLGGSNKAEVQLVIIISDEKGILKTWPPDPQSQTFPMDFFQVISLKNYMGGTTVLYSGPVTGTLSIRVVANNVNKGAITKAQIDIIKALGGGDFTALKALIPDKELIGTCWQTWLPENDWGTGSQYTNDDPQANADLKIWGRIGSNQMPPELPTPILKPNVEIVGKLPTNAKVRTTYNYNESDFAFTLRNNESFPFPIYWRIETNSKPGTEINYLTYPTEGQISILAKGTIPQNAKYWFDTPGIYNWKYIAEYPKDNPIASWSGTLNISP